jgi:hypothetical protein
MEGIEGKIHGKRVKKSKKPTREFVSHFNQISVILSSSYLLSDAYVLNSTTLFVGYFLCFTKMNLHI